jgi:hypothetical protein
MFYEGLYLYQKTGVNTARTLHIEQQETEKIETEVRLIDVNRILITEVYACCPGWHSGWS